MFKLDLPSLVAPTVTIPNKLIGGAVQSGLNLFGSQAKASNDPAISPGQMDAASLAGLQLGQTLTGQDIATTGTQIQDLLQKQLGLTEQGGNNPITSAMQANKAQALASVNQEMARAGVKGGAAAAGKLQASRKLDRDIAAQAYQQYQDSLGQARQMLGGIASAQLAPKYQEQQAAIAANQPQYKPQQPGLLGQIFSGIF